MQMSILHDVDLARMMRFMSATVEPAQQTPPSTRSTFLLRFISTIALWSVALSIAFSGHESLYFLLISVFGLLALYEFYRLLDARSLPNFKITGLLCAVVMLLGSFYYFSKLGPAQSYDFEVSVLLFCL